MGRCINCGRRGLFLRLDAYGLCSSCQEENRRIAEMAAHIITGSTTHITDPIQTESEYPKKSIYFKDSEGNRISKKEYPCVYDYSALLEVESNGYMLGSDTNKQQAVNDIMCIASGLEKAIEICPEIPFYKANASALKFDYIADDYYVGKISALRFCPKTPKGNLRTILYEMNYRFMEDLFGEISYSKNGLYGGKITIWKRKRIETPTSSRTEGTCWQVDLRKSDSGEIIVNSITRHSKCGNRELLYRAQKKKSNTNHDMIRTEENQ